MGAARWATPPIVCALAACLPDIDFFWGRHNMETHSVGFAVLVGLAVFIWRRDARLSAAVALAVGSHVLFDWLGSDDSPPLGRDGALAVQRPVLLCRRVRVRGHLAALLVAGFFTHNLLAVAREIAILGPIVAVIWWRRTSKRRHLEA